MKGRQLALMPGNEDKVGYWLTPPDLMAKLQKEFHFDFDACPYPRPAGFDGLKEEWGKSNWVNPPYPARGTLHDWIRKGIAERDKGKTVVFVMPTPGWFEVIMPAQPEIRFLGRVSWLNPAGNPTPHPRFPSALFILRPHIRTDNRM
jgi:hypothetical protein